jgi:hypothetical protein
MSVHFCTFKSSTSQRIFKPVAHPNQCKIDRSTSENSAVNPERKFVLSNKQGLCYQYTVPASLKSLSVQTPIRSGSKKKSRLHQVDDATSHFFFFRPFLTFTEPGYAYCGVQNVVVSILFLVSYFKTSFFASFIRISRRNHIVSFTSEYPLKATR